ncbi:MAG: signal peptide peptidase SppA [Calditrichaeota bacterium]|nr:signal peptide peptidase SppA [Calditrichota bacterium]
MKSFFKYLLVLLSGYVILIISVVIFIGILSDSEPIINDNSYLEMTLSGSIPEYVTPNPIEELTGVSNTLDMRKIRENFEKAAVDDRINGILLNIGFLQIGYAKVEELQHLINTYRLSGKKIFAYLELGLTRDYLVATACDSVFLPENSNLFLTGISSEVTFYKGFFDKIGVKADFVHIGEYKNAPDQYTREDMSDAQRESLNNIIDQFYDFIINNISEYRNLDAEHVKNLINNKTGFTGKEALENNLVDGNSYKEDIVKLLRQQSEDPIRVSGATYSGIPISSLGIRTASRIAVINIVGTISNGNDVDDPIMGKLAGANTIAQNISAAAKSSSTKAIILRIDSPGGSAIAADIILNSIRNAAKEKPVIASISDYGASGGYYIAAGADTIICSRESLIGSIGIFAGKFSLGGLYKKLGINSEQLKRGENAALFSTNSLWSPSERQLMTHLLNEYYINFVQVVANSRNREYDEIDNIARGRVWSGSDGLKNGLSDTLGTFYDAIDAAKRMAHIADDESVRLSYYPREKDFFSELYSFVSLRAHTFNLLSELDLGVIEQFQNHPLALMPFIIEWK